MGPPKFSLRKLANSLPFSSEHQSGASTGYEGYTTEAEGINWNLIGPAKECLAHEIEQIYWDGVKSELASILLTLCAWSSPEYASISVDDEADDFVHGFDTFMDQVSSNGREHAERFRKFALLCGLK